MKYSALQKKFVVNEHNGEMIGFITDLDLNSHSLCNSQTGLQGAACSFPL